MEHAVISDALSQMEINLVCARCVLQDVTDDFFGFDQDTDFGKFSINWTFEKYGNKAYIASDYLHRAFMALDALQQKLKDTEPTQKHCRSEAVE